jgi:tetratricopeptide (TPR) repeat protein
VAVKLLPPWLGGDPAAKERLAAEARSASAIDHPNIATLHDVVEMPDGALALVMAHYEGETLRARLGRGPLPVEEAVEIARQVASGLLAAHQHGIVHRDIKPGNLLLTSGGLVKILDFGIAKALDADVTATGTGPARGTTAYMSPEQVRGDAVDHRSDLWSLGVVLHEMVTGGHPFRGDRDAGILRSILEDEPPPPDPPGSTAPVRLARVLAWLLAKNPADRCPDAVSLLQELDAVTETGGAAARATPAAPSGRARGRWWIPRQASTRRAIVMTAVGLGLVSVLATWTARRMAPQLDGSASVDRVAILPFEVHGSPEVDYLGSAIVDLLSSGLDGAGGLQTVDPRTLLDGARGVDLSDPREAAGLAARFGAPRYVLGEIVEAEGRLRIRAGLYEPMGGPEPVARAVVEGPVERLFNMVDEMAAQLLVEIHEDPVRPAALVAQRTTSSLPALKAYFAGRTALRQGRFADAIANLRRAITQDSLFALAYYDLSKAAAWGRQMDLSYQAADRAAELAHRLPERERLLVLAYHAYVEGEVARSERSYRRLLADYPSTTDGWSGLAELLFHYNPLRGRPKFESRPYFDRAIRFDPRLGEAIFHRMETAVWQQDRRRFEDLWRELEGPQPIWSALRALEWGTAEERSRALEELAATNEHEVMRTLEAVEFTGDLVAAGRVARLLDDPARPAEWRVLARHTLAEIEMGRGRARAGLAESERIAEFDPSWSLVSRGLLATTPLGRLPRDEMLAIHAGLVAWEPGSAAPSVNNDFREQHDSYREEIRLYLLGLLEVRLGKLGQALERANALDRRARSTAAGADVGRALAAGVRANVFHMRGDHARALAILEAMPLPPREDRSPILSQPNERWLRGEILLDLGRLQEALRWYRSVDEFFPGFRTRAAAVLRMAQVYERLGDRAAAAREYDRFVRYWMETDPELRPQLDFARERLAKLR